MSTPIPEVKMEHYYEPISETKVPPTPHGPHNAVRAYFASPWLVLKDIVLFVLAVPGLLVLLSPSLLLDDQRSQDHGHATTSAAFPQPVTPLGTCNCGASVAEARATGCIFDVLAAAWLPPHCRDAELTAEFELSGNEPDGTWKYYLDPEHTQEISVSELGDHADNPDFRFYNEPEWHTVHCLFYWRKQNRARIAAAKGGGKDGFMYVEPRYDTEQHINHCSGFIRKDKGSSVQAGIVFISDYL